MAVGLGKDSPVVLKLTRENYEAMIERHGQWVRILNHNRCTCVLDSGHPDPNCPVCNGDGIFYTFQRAKNLYSQVCTVSALDGDVGVGEIDEEDRGEIEAVFINGQRLDKKDYSIIDGRYIISPLLKKWDGLTVNSRVSMCTEFEGEVFARGENVLELNEAIESDLRRIAVDIVEVEQLFCETMDGVEEVAVEKAERNLIYTKEALIEGAVYKAKLSYAKPVKAVIHSQQGNRVIQRFLSANGLDSAMTVAYEIDVMRDDVVTLLYADRIEQVVIPKGESLPQWFVAELIFVRDREREYVNGVDYRLKGRNRIEWLKEENAPPDGVNLTVKFRSHPSYRISGDFQHEIRSAENQPFPRMVGLKLITVGGDASREGVETPVAMKEKTTIDEAAREFFEAGRGTL